MITDQPAGMFVVVDGRLLRFLINYLTKEFRRRKTLVESAPDRRLDNELVEDAWQPRL